VSQSFGSPGSLEIVSQVRRENELAKARREAEAADLFAQGQRAESEGKANVAKIYYQMASRGASPALRDKITARLAALNPAKREATPLADR